MRKMFSLLSIWMLALAAVPALADAAPEPPEPKVSDFKAPWTAEEIRKAWGKGASFLLLIETEDGGGSWSRFEADEITEKGFRQSGVTCEKGSAPRRDKEKQTTWEKHLEGLKRMIGDAKASETEIQIPYGKFKAQLYTTSGKDGTIKVWLSKDVAGMFLQVEREAMRGEKRDYEKWTLKSIDAPVFDAPWTYDKIAENWKDGSRTVYAGKSSSGNAKVEYEVSACDINGMTYSSVETLEGREPQKHDPMTITWDSYIRYFMPPRYDSFTSEEKIKTPLGETACIVQMHKSESKGVKISQKVWLAKDEPGLMVKLEMEQEMDGPKMFYNMELTEYSKGKK